MARLPFAPVLRPFHRGAGGVYTFLGEFGRVAANLSVEATLHAIRNCAVLSSLGSVAAYWLNDRIGFLGSQSAVLFLLYRLLLPKVRAFVDFLEQHWMRPRPPF